MLHAGWAELQGWKLRQLVSATRKMARRAVSSKDKVLESLKKLVMIRKRAERCATKPMCVKTCYGLGASATCATMHVFMRIVDCALSAPNPLGGHASQRAWQRAATLT